MALIVADEAQAQAIFPMGATLPSARGYASAVWDGAGAYVFGGINSADQQLNSIMRYDPATDAVSTMSATLPSTQAVNSAVWDGANAYIFGGYDPNGCINRIVRYNPATNAVTTMSATLPTARAYTSAIWDGANAYIFGGYTCGGRIDSIVRYNPATNTVTTMSATLPSGRADTSAIWDGSNAYIFGGFDASGTRLNSIIRYNPATNTVTTMGATLPTARYHTSAIWDGTNAYVFGGDDGARVSSVIRYNPATDTATTMSVSLPAPREFTSAVWDGSNAYIFGGKDGSTFFNDILRYDTDRPPAAPTNLAATTGTQGKIALTWDAATSPAGIPVESYNIYRGTASGGPYSIVGSSDSLQHMDSDLATGPYYYRVRAVNADAEGPESNEATALASGPVLGVDGYSSSEYRPESPTGNTPFGGAALKSPFPDAKMPATVNLAKGEFVGEFPLLSVSNPVGSDFAFAVTQRSMGNPDGNPRMSWGWDATWLQRLEADGSDYLHYTGDGRILRYTSAAGGYDGPPGTYTRLVSSGGNWELQDRDGMRRVFDTANLRLTDLYDAAGNHWVIAYAADGTITTLTDSLSRAYTFNYATTAASASNPFYVLNGKRLLTGVTDFAGRTSTIEYDMSTGHITGLKTHGATSGTYYTTRFTYDSSHRLLTIRDNDNEVYHRNQYDSFGRVTAQLSAGGPAQFFRYYHDDGLTFTWDGNGNKDEWRFGATPRVVPASHIESTRGLRIGDPASFTTTYTHNSQDEITGITYPAGNSVTYLYDESSSSFYSRGNLLRETRSPGSIRTALDENNFQTSIVTEYQYDATYNVVTKIIDARGTGTYTPPNGGTVSAARYTTQIIYDFHEATLGDQNGDGVTSSTDRKPVKIIHPTVNAAGSPHSAFTTAYANQARVETLTWNTAGQLLKHVDPAGVEETRAYYASSDDLLGDSSGNAHGLTQVGTLTQVPAAPGYTNYGVGLAGFAVGSFLTRVDSAFALTGDFAFAGSFTLNGLTGAPQNIVVLETNSLNRDFGTLALESDGRVVFHHWVAGEAGGKFLFSSLTVAPGTHTFTVSRLAGQVLVKIDGVVYINAAQTGTANPNGSGAKLLLGMGDGGMTTNHPLNGAIREVRIWGSSPPAQATLDTLTPGVAQGSELSAYFLEPGRPNGYLKSVTSDDGGVQVKTSYEYTSFGVVNKVTDANGNVRTYAVDQRGRVTQETGPAPTSYRTKWTYDANDNVVKLERETDSATNVYASTTYDYNALGWLVKETVDADRSNTIDTALTGQGTAPAESYAVLYAYDGNSNLIERTVNSEAQSWAYDERGLLLQQSGPDGGTYAYDANGNLASVRDQRGNATQYDFDGYDRPSVTIDALGNVFVQNYDAASNVVRERGFQGSSTGTLLYERAHHHDEANQAYRVDELHQVPSGSSKAPTTGTLTPNDDWVTTLHERDARGLVTRGINDNSHVTAMEYDDVARLASTTDAIGNEVAYTYDDNGNVLEVVETDVSSTGGSPQAYTTEYTIDSENRVTVVTNPDSTTKAFNYDGRGNVLKVIDELANEVRTFYDNADRPWVVRHKLDASTNVDTTTHWDAVNRPLRRCDDADQCTTYTYVPGTQLVASESSPVLPGSTYAYDANGNRVRTTPGSGRDINMVYDQLNRVVVVEAEPDPVSFGTTRQTFTYDALGRITQATDDGVDNLGSDVATQLNRTTINQRYDSLGRVVTEAQNYLAIHHTRDGVGNVVKSTYPTVVASFDLSDTNAQARVVSRSYDANERLDRVWDSNGLIIDYLHHGDQVWERYVGGPTPSVPATGAISPTASTIITLDDMRRPSLILHQDAGATTLAGFETRFDAVGNRVAEKHLPATAAQQSQLFGLDALNRATSWKRGAINTALDTIASPVKQSTWTPDGRNEWASWSPTTGTTCSRSTTSANDLQQTCGTAPMVTYDRDANGNLADDGTFVYKWDFLNRLVRVENKATGDLVVGYGYDAFDRRIVKIHVGQIVPTVPLVPPQQGELEAWYTYAGQHAVQESRPEWTGGAAVPSAVHVIRQWVYGSAVDEVLEMAFDSNRDELITPLDPRHYYHHDALGSVIGLTDESGRLVEGYLYQPYGGVEIRTPGCGTCDVEWDASDNVVAASPSGNIWYFTGRQYDPETGTYHYRARQYHPGLGQFISMDPIGVWGDAGNLGNPYAYVGNNPSTYTDPYGLWSKKDNRQLICEGGSAIAFAFVPGAGLGCAANRDWESDGAVFNEGLNIDYALSPLDAIPAGTGARAGVKGSFALGGFLLKHADEGAQLAQVARHADQAAVATGHSDEFAGVRELSQTLRTNGLPRDSRLAVIRSFESGSITARTATGGESLLRIWGGDALERGRYLTPNLEVGASARATLALPLENTASHLSEFGMKPGTRFFEGTASSKFGLPGGGRQVYAPDTGMLELRGRYW